MSDFIQYLHKIINAPVRIKNIDGYIYEISSEPSILNERCAEGRISDKIQKRLIKNKKIQSVGFWQGNILKIKFKPTSKPIKEGL